MKRILVLIPLLLLACLAGVFYLGSIRPFAPSARLSGDVPPPLTLQAALPPPPSHVPLPTLTPSPTPTGAPAAPEPTQTPTDPFPRARVPSITPTPTRTSALDVALTQTAIQPQMTMDAISTRAYATFTPTPGPSPTPRDIDTTTNILLLGSDLRPTDPTWVPATDVIIVLFLDTQNNRAALISLPRDLVVAIPGYDAFRINYVYYMGEKRYGPGGGPELLKRVLHDEFHIHIDHWAMVDLNGYQKIIDTLGGIDVRVPCPLSDTIDQQPFVIPAGEVHMDALTARRYIQSRYSTSDTSRNFRQQRVLWAMLKKGLQLDALDKLPTLWAQFHDVVQTDMSLFDIASLVPFATQLDPQNYPDRIHAQVLDYPAVYPFIAPSSGAWLFLPNYDDINARLAGIFDAPPLGRTSAGADECPPPLPTDTPTVTGTPPTSTPTATGTPPTSTPTP